MSTYTTSGCSTSVVVGLSKQIAQEVGCMSPGALVAFQPGGNLTFSSNAVLPYLHSTARTDLLSVASTRSVQVNSGFRTVAQQYLLYRWYQLGRCGISAAATPGRSNHQSGRAVDLANYSSLISAMSSKGWTHPIPGDPVHFEHPSSPDIRGKDVQAFQRLWNRNNPADKISEDGAYGPQTEARLKQAPATGFAVGASCGAATAAPVDVVMIDGPDKLAPGARGRYSITLSNTMGTDWPGTAKLVVVDGSELHDDTLWTSPTEVGTLDSLGGGAIGAGAQGVIEIPVLAPMVSEVTAYSAEIALVDNGTTLGTIQLALSVTPNGDEDSSGDAGDEDGEHEHDEGEFEAGTVSGGCSTGGSIGWLALVLPALLLSRRRR